MEQYEARVTAAQHGDIDAFGQLVVQFQDMAYWVAYRYLGQRQAAQDAAQEAFFEAYRSLSNLREPIAFPVWLRRIVLKQCDRQTRRQRPPLVELDEELLLVATAPGPDAMLEQMQHIESIRTAIRSLPLIYRQVTTLFYLHGRSYADMAIELNLPLSTIRKRLYAARQQIKEQLSPMTTKTYRPSRDDTFANRIKFFIALKNDDLLQVRQLLRHTPDLLHTQTEWGIAADGWYWPLGITPLHWAASTGNRPLAELLREHGADLDIRDRSGSTPLARAAHMGQTELVRWLLEQGADPNLAAQNGQTSLHAAVIRNRTDIVEILLLAAADTAVRDNQGRTPLDWAIAKNLSSIVHCFGNMDLALPSPSQAPVLSTSDRIWETGIKIIDLIAPLKWCGRNGLFTPLSGIGIDVMVGELVHRMAVYQGGTTVQVVLERGDFNAVSRMWQWRNCGVDGHVTLFHCRQSDSTTRQQHTLETAVAQVQSRAAHQPVLFIIDTGFQSLLKNISSYPNVTILFDGIETIGAEPPELADLDTAITFDYARGKQGLWPAIDMLQSYCHTYQDHTHAAVAQQAVRLARRYADLSPIYENQGMAGFDMAYYGDVERQAVQRGRRLHRYLTQPLVVAEPWSATPSEFVPLVETMKTTQAILAGEFDEVPEDDLLNIGKWSPAWT